VVGVWLLFPADTIASAICRAATGSFMVSSFMSSDGRYLGDPIVNSNEVGVFSKFRDDLAHANPQSMSCYRGDRHEHCSGVVCTQLAT
jgi:hypothetical protein